MTSLPEAEDGAAAGSGGPAARASAWVAIVAVLVGVVLAPPGDDAFAGGAFGRVVAGVVEVGRGTGWDVVPVGDPVPQGAAVRTRDEAAELEVRGGRLSLSRFADLTVGMDTVELDRGELLFEADRTFEVRFGAVSGTGRGTWRVSASGVARYAVYDGGVAVAPADGGDAFELGRLRESAVAAGGAEPARPLRYLPSDAWDQRLLADAIRVDQVLAATRDGLALRYGRELQQPAFYGDFARFEGLLDQLPRLAVVADDGRFGPPAETLVALIVAELLVADAGLRPADAAAEIDTLRRAGAEWGLIVVAHDLVAGDLDRTIERAIRQRGEEVEEGTATPPEGPGPDGPDTGPTPSTPPDDPDGDPDGPDDPDDPGDPGGDPPPPPDDPDDGPGTLDPVEDSVDDVGSLLDEVVPGASDVTDEVSDVVDTVDDLLP